MRNYKNTIILFLISTLFLLGSCVKNIDSISENSTTDTKSVEVKTKAQKLADVVFQNGYVINVDTAPKIISATEVYNLINDNIHILDIRKAKDFADGHIKNAVNIKMSEVLDYAQVKGLPLYDKVIIICYTGQTASFSVAILQMLGHDNVYVLEWGMCSWNQKFNIKWKKNISDNGINSLVTTTYLKNEPSTLPLIESVKNSGQEILYTRARALLKESFGKSAISFKKAESIVMANEAYIICYQPESVYNNGHLENAILYDQKDSFNLTTDLLTLPKDKTIIIYSDKSFQSAYITVYLKMLGYKAKTLKYGANSFMNSKQIKIGTGFSNSLIIDYPYETSIYIEVVGEVQEGGC